MSESPVQEKCMAICLPAGAASVFLAKSITCLTSRLKENKLTTLVHTHTRDRLPLPAAAATNRVQGRKPSGCSCDSERGGLPVCMTT